MAQDTQAHKSQRALDHAQDELTKLITENQQLRSQLQDQDALRREVTWLKSTIDAHRDFMKKLAQLVEKYGIDKYPVSVVYIEQSFSVYRKWKEVKNKQWFDRVEKELEFAKEMKDARLSEEKKRLRSQLKNQAARDVELAVLRTADGKHRKIAKELEQLARKHHGDNSGVPRFNYTAPITRSREKKEEEEKEWFDWVDKELQFAKEVREAYGRMNQAGASSIEAGGMVNRKRSNEDPLPAAGERANKRSG